MPPKRIPRQHRLALTAVAVSMVAAPVSAAAGGPPTTARPPHAVSTGTRLLLIGLDGADWQIAGPLIDAGRLPNLARLRREGAWGDLRSSQPMLSPLLWSSIATG